MALERQVSHAAHWSEQQYDQMLLTSGGDAPERFACIAEISAASQLQDASAAPPQVVAFLIAHRIAAEWELENIAVSAEARRQGIGERLARELIAHARAEHGEAITLEVRESNRAARALYGKLGFVETGLRKGYYSNPSESAILCQLSL